MTVQRGTLRLLRMSGVPIVRQLHVGEALYRADEGNWFMVNDGTDESAIVMGISGKPGELVDLEAAHKRGVKLIRRYSGGGTVTVDHNTVFASLIVAPGAVPEVQPFPESIMRWSEGFYAPAFRTVLLQDGATYGLRENDYVVGARKFGGNAQAISRGRWVHHTSFLWDYDSENMRLLRNPRRQPKYREGRGHEDFVCREAFVEALCGLPSLAGWKVAEVPFEEVAEDVLKRKHLRTTRVVDILPGGRTQEGGSQVIGGDGP